MRGAGLDRDSLAECLTHGAPPGLQAEWSYGGRDLKSIYQWLGGGHGKQAHPLAIQLLIEVARGRGETPLVALKRHRGDLEQKIEEKLLGDLYNNVLYPPEQRLLKALALYRTAIPHDHAEALERRLAVSGAWERLDRRCLLSSNADHSQYYVHSFIAGWVRMRMGYEGHGEDAEADFADGADRHSRQEARELHSAVAACWLGQLGRSRRVTNLNIGRAATTRPAGPTSAEPCWRAERMTRATSCVGSKSWKRTVRRRSTTTSGPFSLNVLS